MDYVVSDRGAAFIKDALALCKSTGVSWDSMWLEQDLSFLKELRETLSLNLSDYETPEETGRVLGTIAFIYTLQNVAAGEAKLHEAADLLRESGLVTTTNISVAAATFGISTDAVRELVVLG